MPWWWTNYACQSHEDYSPRPSQVLHCCLQIERWKHSRPPPECLLGLPYLPLVSSHSALYQEVIDKLKRSLALRYIHIPLLMSFKEWSSKNPKIWTKQRLMNWEGSVTCSYFVAACDIPFLESWLWFCFKSTTSHLVSHVTENTQYG